MKSIVLLSGGLDSTVSLVKATEVSEVTIALTFDYGQRAAKREIEAARRISKIYRVKHRVIGLPWLAEITSTALVNRREGIPIPSGEEIGRPESAEVVWVPNRNSLFVAIAASFAEGLSCQLVVAGFNREEAEVFPDNSLPFIEAVNQSLGYSTLSNVRLTSFVSSLNKKEIASEAIRLSLPLRYLWCCYSGGRKMCGLCESCQRTIRAFKRIERLDYIRDNFYRLVSRCL